MIIISFSIKNLIDNNIQKHEIYKVIPINLLKGAREYANHRLQKSTH